MAVVGACWDSLLWERDPESMSETLDRADDSRSTTTRPVDRLSGIAGTRVVDRPPPISGDVVVCASDVEVKVNGVAEASAEEPEDAIAATRVGSNTAKANRIYTADNLYDPGYP